MSWGQGHVDNSIGWGQGDNNDIGWGEIYGSSASGDTALSGVPFDTDAQAFITAASITDPTQQSAVNQLVVDLKSASIWTKMEAVYPMVGGSASSHKYNLKDPRDLDAAFRLGFSGGLTHNSNGVTGGGINGYFSTYIVPFSILQLNNTSIWAYSRTQIALDGSVLIASESNPISDSIQINPRNSSDISSVRLNSSDFATLSSTNSTGLFGVSRANSSNVNYWIRGVKNTLTLASSGLNASNIVGLYFSGTGTYSQRNICFTAIGQGLSDTEADDLYTAVQTYQTTLSRNV